MVLCLFLENSFHSNTKNLQGCEFFTGSFIAMKKNKQNDDEDEPGSSKNQNTQKPKSLRFRLPVDDRSEESFSSALSYNDDETDDYEDFTPPTEMSVLKKYIFTPLQHSHPRSAPVKSCVRFFSDENIENFLPSTSSSKQLFEILGHSPTPSDADLRLINATYLRKLSAVKEAIRNGADVNTYRDRQTPLLIATEIGDARLVGYLLTVANINPDFQNHFGQTPLIVAIRNAFDKIVRLLLSHNANVNLSDNMGKSPLHQALFQRRPSLVKLLLAYGANYEHQDCFGEKPMYTSVVKKPHMECLLILLKMGASPEYSNITGMPLLTRAILSGTKISILEVLIKYGASVNTRDLVTGKTPLHYAALINNADVAALLMDYGADVNIQANNFTPLHEAIVHGSVEVLELLAERTGTVRRRAFPFLTTKSS